MPQTISSHIYVKRLKLANKVRQLMEERRLYENPAFCIQHLARELGTNRSYASALFKSELGHSFIDFVNTYRLRDAELLLRTTTLPITVIFKQVGFGTPLSFRRAFEKKNGMTPTAYRELYAQRIGLHDIK